MSLLARQFRSVNRSSQARFFSKLVCTQDAGPSCGDGGYDALHSSLSGR